MPYTFPVVTVTGELVGYDCDSSKIQGGPHEVLHRKLYTTLYKQTQIRKLYNHSKNKKILHNMSYITFKMCSFDFNAGVQSLSGILEDARDHFR